MRNRKYVCFVCDFETTVYEGQEYTEVWASACVKMNTEDVHIFHSIDETYEFFLAQKANLICYYHNLKFDGTFWLSFLITKLKYQQALEEISETQSEFLEEWHMKNNTFKYCISDRGQWYNIVIKAENHIIQIRDSLKLLPFSVKRIGESFGTKHKKLTMEYKGFRYAGCEITDEEKTYIANDVLVVKEALEFMFAEGHNKLTIGSCCLEEYKKMVTAKKFPERFPNLYNIELDKDVYGSDSVGEWIRHSYKGGWCYLVKGKEKRKLSNGCTADVNSLYPSMMSSESGNKYPVGLPKSWTGNFIPDVCNDEFIYYFVRIRTRFYLKPGKLPFIQIKGNMLYDGTVALESSDIYDKKTGRYYNTYIDLDGLKHDTRVTLTLTMTDYKLFMEHYEVVDFEILDGFYFLAMVGIFDEYIEKYKKIKIESKGARRELAKLFLNNLYGKMASNTDSSFKVAYEKEDGSIGFYPQIADDKEPGYIPVGSAITSYARNFTIRAAQMNYHGKNKPGFVYADTDSIHCDLPPSEVVGITIHPTNFCCWKLETVWDIGWFVRQKTYIEHVIIEDVKPDTMTGTEVTPYYNVKCAGMPDKCKNYFLKSMEGYTVDETDEYTPEQREFMSKKRTLEDFTIGLKVPGKLMPKRIKGGTLLVDSWYEMR